MAREQLQNTQRKKKKGDGHRCSKPLVEKPSFELRDLEENESWIGCKPSSYTKCWITRTKMQCPEAQRIPAYSATAREIDQLRGCWLCSLTVGSG